MIRRVIVALVALTIVASPVPALAFSFDTPRPSAPKSRVIEVVDRIGPTAWNVRKAVDWLDRYTASDMRMVKRCSGTAYRCVIFRTGTVKRTVGWSSGSTITVDLKRAKSLNKYYRHARHRHWLLVHELGHQFGLPHRGGRNVMNDAVNRYAMALTAAQRRHLRSR